MCSLPPFSQTLFVSTNNAGGAAVVTVLTNPAPLGIQTFLENVHLYIYLYSYIHISNIFVAVYAFECKRFSKEYMRIICRCWKSKPRGCSSSSSSSQRSPIAVVHCPHMWILLFILWSPLFQKETFMSPPDHTHICIYFCPLFSPEQFYIRFFFCQANVTGF